MMDHAFGGLGLHRIGLSVFSFNDRAIRSYRSCGFVVEGRAREAIWRDGRWWDEIAMSILDSDWAVRRGSRQGTTAAVDRQPDEVVAVGAGVGRLGRE
jgi:hypothetical protein